MSNGEGHQPQLLFLSLLSPHLARDLRVGSHDLVQVESKAIIYQFAFNESENKFYIKTITS